MSASFKLTGPTFPDGTTVKAYPASNWPTPGQPSGAPVGTAAAEGTVNGSAVTLSGLTKGTEYWATAEVGGHYRYVGFTAGADTAEVAEVLHATDLGAPSEAGKGLSATDLAVVAGLDQVVYLHKYLDQAKVGKEEDVSAEFSAADKVAEEQGAILVLPNYAIVLRGTTSRANAANSKWRIVRSGPKSKIIDKNTSGPILSYVRSDGNQGSVIWDFDYELACQKPESSCFRLEELRTSHSRINIDVRGNNTTKFYKCREVFRCINMWEMNFAETSFSEIVGHTIWYDCPDLNGGNVDLSNVHQVFCVGGVVIKGNSTTNNVLFGNFKALNSNAGRQYVKKFETSLPAAGVTEVQIETGVAANFFPAGGTVILYSAAGLDILHLDASAPYNATTGKLKFWDAVTKNHAGQTDMRVFCATNWGIITDFFAPNLSFKASHFERSPCFIKDAHVTFDDFELSVAHQANDGEPNAVFAAGKNTNVVFRTGLFARPGSEEPRTSVIRAVTPAPSANSGIPTFHVSEDVRTPPNQGPMDQASEQWRYYSPIDIYESKSEFPQGCKVKSAATGTQRNTMKAESAWRSPRKVNATTTLLDNDDIVIATVGNITLSLPSLRNKQVTIVKADANENAPIKIKAASAGVKIEGQEEIRLVIPNSSVTIVYEKESNEFRIVASGIRRREAEGTAELPEGSASKEVEHHLGVEPKRVQITYEGEESSNIRVVKGSKTATTMTLARSVTTKAALVHWRAVY
jgi:hypothetical protein